MKILVAVAVILVLVFAIALFRAYRHRALVKDTSSAQWMVTVQSVPLAWNEDARPDLRVSLILVTPRGEIKDKSQFAYIIGADQTASQKLFDAKIDAQNRADLLNGN